MPSSALENKERQPCEVWTRVMGYHKPVFTFNRGKKQEFSDRRQMRPESAEDLREEEEAAE